MTLTEYLNQEDSSALAPGTVELQKHELYRLFNVAKGRVAVLKIKGETFFYFISAGDQILWTTDASGNKKYPSVFRLNQ